MNDLGSSQRRSCKRGVAGMRIRRVVSAECSPRLVAIRICRHSSGNACDGAARDATHMSMEPSRAACSRISLLVNMTVVCCV